MEIEFHMDKKNYFKESIIFYYLKSTNIKLIKSKCEYFNKIEKVNFF